jgi:hypothetical protein
MQISWGSETLSDGTKVAAARGLRVSLRGLNLSQPYVRSTTVANFDRKNWSAGIGFHVTRTLDSVAAAEGWLTTHPEALKVVGKADLTIVYTGGSTRLAKNAILTGFDARYLGKSVEADYQFSAEYFANPPAQ